MGSDPCCLRKMSSDGQSVINGARSGGKRQLSTCISEGRPSASSSAQSRLDMLASPPALAAVLVDFVSTISSQD